MNEAQRSESFQRKLRNGSNPSGKLPISSQLRILGLWLQDYAFNFRLYVPAARLTAPVTADTIANRRNENCSTCNLFRKLPSLYISFLLP